MIVRDASGNTKIVSDHLRGDILKGGINGVQSQKRVEKLTPPELERIARQQPRPKKGAMGSGAYGNTGGYLGSKSHPFSSIGGYMQRDDTDYTFTQRKSIRDLFRQNPMAYIYAYDPPREAIYSPDGLNIVKQDDQNTQEGVKHIKEWLRLFERMKGQEPLMEVMIGAAFYYRLFGEVLVEIRMLRNEHLNIIGYPDNVMIGSIELISPLLLRDIQYDPKTGNIKYLELPNSQGAYQRFEGEALKNFIYFHNMPANERRGITRLFPNKRWLEGFDDLLEMTLEMHFNDARPIEHHKLTEDGLSAQEIENMKDEHEETIKEMRDDGSRALMTSGRIEIELLGMQGRTLESAPIIDKTKGYIHQGIRIPASFVEAKNANKATIDVQEKHYHKSQLEAVDRFVAKKLAEQYVFPAVLMTRGASPLLTPKVQFPPFTAANALEQAMTDQIEVSTFGYERAIQIAQQRGYSYDATQPQNNNNSNELAERIKEALLRNGIMDV